HERLELSAPRTLSARVAGAASRPWARAGAGNRRMKRRAKGRMGHKAMLGVARPTPTAAALGAPRRPVAVGDQSAHAGQWDHAGAQSVLSDLMRVGFAP